MEKMIASENELLKHLPALVDCPGPPDVERTMLMSVIAVLFYMFYWMQKTAFFMIVCCRGF